MDPPTLVPWTSVGDIALGDSLKHVSAEYGREGPYGYHVHHGVLDVESNFAPLGRVNWIYFTTPYYRTKSGFGVGTTFPRSWQSGFIWNPTLKESPCRCWVKVGRGRRSLQPSVANFGKPWVIVDVSHGRVTSILMSSRYAD